MHKKPSAADKIAYLMQQNSSDGVSGSGVGSGGSSSNYLRNLFFLQYLD
jgi:hypothetical protein